MHVQNLVKFYQLVLKILSRNQIMTEYGMTDNPKPVQSRAKIKCIVYKQFIQGRKLQYSQTTSGSLV